LTDQWYDDGPGGEAHRILLVLPTHFPLLLLAGRLLHPMGPPARPRPANTLAALLLLAPLVFAPLASAGTKQSPRAHRRLGLAISYAAVVSLVP
jgi:hypothetical protein